MFFMNGLSTDAKFWLMFAAFCAIVFAFLGIMAIIEAIDEKKEERKRRKYGKRYTVEIRPWEKY